MATGVAGSKSLTRRVFGAHRNISKATWLAVAILIVTITSLVVASFISLTYGQDLADGLADGQLEGRASVKADEVARYIRSMESRTAAIAGTQGAVANAQRFNSAYAELGGLAAGTRDEAKEIVDRFYREDFAPALEAAVGVTVGWRSLVPAQDEGVYLQRHYVERNEAGESLVDDAGDGSSWSEVHRELHLPLLELATRLGAADLYLIEPASGVIVYSAAKQPDFATSLDIGPHSGSTLAVAMRAVREAPERGSVTVVDVAPYLPDLGAPMFFMASPILNGNDLVGILAIKLPGQPIDSILTSDGNWLEEGFGETGEVYLVGTDGRMRSVARPFLEDPESFLVDLEAAGAASEDERLAMGGVGTTSTYLKVADSRELAAAAASDDVTREGTNYLQRKVLTAVEPLDVADFQWFVVAEQELEEVTGPIGNFRRSLLIAVAVFVIGITFATVAWARAVFRPVRAISEKLRRIREGEPVEETEAARRAPSDFTDLASSIDGMLEALLRRETELDAASEQRLDTVRGLLPPAIAERVERGDRDVVDHIPQAAIVVLAFDGLGELLATANAVLIRELLDQLINEIDAAAIHHGLERVKLVGDSYYAGCGLSQPYLDHVPRSIAFALDVKDVVSELNSGQGTGLGVAAGVHSGPVTAGLGGSTHLVYDVWGEAVGVAHFLARLAQPGEVLVSGEVSELLPSDIEVAAKPVDEAARPVFAITGHLVVEDAPS